jgi:hypothetical protein
MEQLGELRLGSSGEKLDGNSNTFTYSGFKTVLTSLKNMPKLAKLEMQLPNLKEFDIRAKGFSSLFESRIGERGAQFIA